MPLSDTRIRTLKPAEKPYKVFDFEGLYLLVKPSGARLWHLKYRFAGREKLLALGPYPAVGLADARRAREEAKALLAQGLDPSEARKAKKAKTRAVTEHSFGFQADAFLAKCRAEQKAEATMVKAEWLLGMAKATFGRRPMPEIDSPTVLKLLRKIEAKGNYETARRLRSKIGAVFRYAIAGGVPCTDPTQALRDALIRPTVTHRAAIVEKEAMGGLMRAIDGYDGQVTTRIGLQLLALLAQRPGELRQACWVEFDPEARTWTIPAPRMKMRKPHMVPLSPQVLVLLDDLRRFTGTSRYLFPAIGKPKGTMSENTLNASLRRMGFGGDEMTAHGFRASLSTFANESGLWHPDAVELAIAHMKRDVVRRAYVRGEHWDERVRMFDWWADFLDQARALTDRRD